VSVKSTCFFAPSGRAAFGFGSLEADRLRPDFVLPGFSSMGKHIVRNRRVNGGRKSLSIVRAETPIPSRGLPSEEFIDPDNIPKGDADCEKEICAQKNDRNATPAKRLEKQLFFAAKRLQKSGTEQLQRLQIHNEIVHFFRFESILKTGHIRPALQIKPRRTFSCSESASLNWPLRLGPMTGGDQI